MTNLTKEEYARLHLKAKRGMLTAEERAALEAYEAAAQPAPQTPVPADTETLLCCPYCGHATITTQIVSDVTYRKPATVIAMMFAPLIAVVLAFLLRNMFVTVPVFWKSSAKAPIFPAHDEQETKGVIAEVSAPFDGFVWNCRKDADTALCCAKAAGKNRVALFSAPG